MVCVVKVHQICFRYCTISAFCLSIRLRYLKAPSSFKVTKNDCFITIDSAEKWFSGLLNMQTSLTEFYSFPLIKVKNSFTHIYKEHKKIIAVKMLGLLILKIMLASTRKPDKEIEK